MQEVKGEYNTAKVFTDVIDETSLKQIQLLCNKSGNFEFGNFRWRKSFY